MRNTVTSRRPAGPTLTKKPWLVGALLVVIVSACGSSSEQVVSGDGATAIPSSIAPDEPVPSFAGPVSEGEPLATVGPVGTEEATAVATVGPVGTEEATAVATVGPVGAEEATAVATVAPAPPELAVQGPSAGSVAVPVPQAIGVPTEYTTPPEGEPLCVIDIMAPDTLNIRSGPGIEYDVEGALRPDACILRSAGPAVEGWQPVHVIVATFEQLFVTEGWVSSNFVLPARVVSTAEAAVAAHDPAVLTVDAGGDPLLAIPCQQAGADGVFSCDVTGWFWEVASSPCVDRTGWKLGTTGWVEAWQASDGTWTAEGGPRLVLDC